MNEVTYNTVINLTNSALKLYYISIKYKNELYLVVPNIYVTGLMVKGRSTNTGDIAIIKSGESTIRIYRDALNYSVKDLFSGRFSKEYAIVQSRWLLDTLPSQIEIKIDSVIGNVINRNIPIRNIHYRSILLNSYPIIHSASAIKLSHLERDVRNVLIEKLGRAFLSYVPFKILNNWDKDLTSKGMECTRNGTLTRLDYLKDDGMVMFGSEYERLSFNSVIAELLVLRYELSNRNDIDDISWHPMILNGRDLDALVVSEFKKHDYRISVGGIVKS